MYLLGSSCLGPLQQAQNNGSDTLCLFQHCNEYCLLSFAFKQFQLYFLLTIFLIVFRSLSLTIVS
jgi:hypothetical protein